jgi:hypothetical protein
MIIGDSHESREGKDPESEDAQGHANRGIVGPASVEQGGALFGSGEQPFNGFSALLGSSEKNRCTNLHTSIFDG